MPSNDELIRAIQRFVDQQAVYRAELTKALLDTQRRVAASEVLLLDTRRAFEAERAATRQERRVLRIRIWFLYGVVACLVLLFIIMTLLSFRNG